MEVRWGGSNVNQIGLFAKELVGLKPDLIVAQGTPVTAALQRETRTIPIVFVVVTDPVGEGFVAALSPATAARAKPRRRASVLTERFGVM
jgi:putative ABC transport system substrate-binding protein